MKGTLLFSILFWRAAHGQILFDASAGTTPGQQGWGYAIAGVAFEVMTNDTVRLDTTNTPTTFAGYAQVPASLDREHGFIFQFSVQIFAENHIKTNRAGFSVIVLAEDKKGVELGFWSDTVFAQNDSPLFVPAESTSFVTTNMVDYELSIDSHQYSLRAHGIQILSGPVRDYTAFSGTINPYSVPNFVFVGDNTTSASADFAIRTMALVRAPKLQIRDAVLIHWQGKAGLNYTVLTSTNLVNWIAIGKSFSPTTEYYYTNLSAFPQQYFRTSIP